VRYQIFYITLHKEQLRSDSINCTVVIYCNNKLLDLWCSNIHTTTLNQPH